MEKVEYTSQYNKKGDHDMNRETIHLLAAIVILAGLLAGCSPVKKTDKPEKNSNPAPVATQTPATSPQGSATSAPPAPLTPLTASTKGYLFANSTQAGFFQIK
jgi:PBP1b-binding outer membrane lipoprotein LpoB